MSDNPKWGPAMKALPNDRWRAACLHFVHGGGGSAGNNKGYVAAYRAAGYASTENAMRVNAHHMFHDARMQAAMQEEARKSMVALIPMARDAVSEIVRTPGHPQQLNAAKTILDRGGIHEVH